MPKRYLAIPEILNICLNSSISLKAHMRVAIPTSTAAYQAAATQTKWWQGGDWEKEDYLGLAEGVSPTPSACLWSVHLDMDMLPLLVQEVTAYSDQTDGLLQHLPSTTSPSSLHILQSEDLLWLKWRKEAEPVHFNWQPGGNGNFLQPGCNRPLGAAKNACPELRLFKVRITKNQTE